MHSFVAAAIAAFALSQVPEAKVHDVHDGTSTTPTPPSPTARDWSVGAGLSSARLFSLGSAQTLQSVGPEVAVVVERRISDSLWVLASGTARFTSFETSFEDPDTSAPSFSSSAYGAEAVVGLRPVLNPDGAIVLSGYGLLGGGARTSQTGLADDTTFLANELVGTAALGVAAEHWLTPSVGVRLSTGLLTVRASMIIPPEGAPNTGSTKTTAVSGGLELQPVASLHLRF